MITRGHLVGYIVDELNDIKTKVIFRNKFGYTDSAKFLENVYKEVLNEMFPDAGFENANLISDNNATYDLISKKEMILFQVTSSLTPEKIIETCNSFRARPELDKYKLKFISIGFRQKTYEGKDLLKAIQGIIEKLDDSIWDDVRFASEIISLNIEKLGKVYKVFKDNSQKLSFNLEIPDEEGKFSNSIFNTYTARQPYVLNKIDKFIDYLNKDQKTLLNDDDQKRYYESMKLLMNFLCDLPRSTREFFTICLSERNQIPEKNPDETIKTLLSLLEKKINLSSDFIKSEVQVMRVVAIRNGLGNFCELDIYEEHPEINNLRVSGNIGHSDFLLHEMIQYAESQKVTLEKVFSKLDLSDFA